MKFTSATLVGGLAAAASAGALENREWKYASVWCDGSNVKTVTETVYAGAPTAPPAPPAWSSGNHYTSVHYESSGDKTYTTVEAWPTGEGKKDCTRVVYHNDKVIKTEIIVIIVVVMDGKPICSTVETKSGQPSATSIPPPVTYTPTGTYGGGGPTDTPTTYDVELRADNGTFHYVPDHVNAKVNDVINFIFKPKAHSVTQSDFNTPCTPNGGFDTGLLNGTLDGSVTRQYTVKDVSKPLWFHCKQKVPVSHCGKGMVFGINPGNKMGDFIKNAIAQEGGANSPPPSGTTSVPSPSGTGTTGLPATHSVVVSGAINVTAGVNSLMYTPPFIARAAKGDKIVFDFRAKNHTVTESSFAQPCTKKSAAAFDTNFQQANPNNIPGAKLAEFIVPDNQPHYFYCRQANGTPNDHCSNGMVFAINIQEQRFNDFKAAAKATPP